MRFSLLGLALAIKGAISNVLSNDEVETKVARPAEVSVSVLGWLSPPESASFEVSNNDKIKKPVVRRAAVSVLATGRLSSPAFASSNISCSFSAEGKWCESVADILGSTRCPSVVSHNRKIATIELAMKALNVAGDFVEVGVFQGGTAILMAKVLQNKDQKRTLWAADSFEGLPDEKEEPILLQSKVQRVGGLQITGSVPTNHKLAKKGKFSASLEKFMRHMQEDGLSVWKNGAWEHRVHLEVLRGWFSDTLPKARIDKIAFLRLDGDLYVSTMDGIKSLYDKVAPGGYVYVDDYGTYQGCRNAIDEYRQKHNITDVMHPIKEDSGKFEAVWWQKGSTS